MHCLNVDQMKERPDISVVVPLFDEAPNVRPLVAAVREALEGRYDWELLLVDDGSRDATREVAAEAASEHEDVFLLGLSRHYGQTTAMQAGFDHARGEVVVTMDGDLQNDPEDIPRLVSTLRRGYDLVVGHRVDRDEGYLTRTLPSRLANLLVRKLTRVEVDDTGCSLKAYRRALVEELQLYSEMHRFIPVLAAATAGARITQVPVRHHPRRHGESKYGLGRTWRVLLDLLTVAMLRWFRERPLAFFVLAGVASGLVGLAFAGASLVLTLTPTPWSASVVYPAAALMCFALTVYLTMVGLLANLSLYGRQPGFLGQGGRSHD